MKEVLKSQERARVLDVFGEPFVNVLRKWKSGPTILEGYYHMKLGNGIIHVLTPLEDKYLTVDNKHAWPEMCTHFKTFMERAEREGYQVEFNPPRTLPTHIGANVRNYDLSTPLPLVNTRLNMQLQGWYDLYPEHWWVASSPWRGRFSLIRTSGICGILTLPHFEAPIPVETLYAMNLLRALKRKAIQKDFDVLDAHNTSSHIEFEILGPRT
eukprot:scaffold176853_cov43-Tisochrysis_lutea.AAC.2